MHLFFLIILCGFLYYRNDRSMLKGLDRFLEDECDDMSFFILINEEAMDAISNRLRVESRGELYYELSFRLLNREGQPLASSRLFQAGLVADIRPEVLHAALKGDTTTEHLTIPDRVSQHFLMTRPVKDPTTGEVRSVLQALAYLEPLDKLSRHFLHNIYSAVPVLVLISWFGGYALARKVLKPVHQIARTARRITSAKLDERLARSESGDEFDRLADTLNEMIGRLEQSFALLRQFAGDAAHELRTPLTIMKGEAEIALRSNTRDAQAYRAVLESNIQECDHMIGIITNLLLVAHAETGDVHFERQPVRLDQLLADLAETFDILADEAGISLEVAHFPEVVVLGDRSRLHELFANLLDNAVKYTPAGGRVGVSCQLDPEEVHVAIADTGVGIPEAEQEKIFDRFYRVDHSRSRETGGSGLGLSIARWIAAAHGGRIEVHSAPGAGSTFTVTLPLPAASPFDAQAERPADTGAEA